MTDELYDEAARLVVKEQKPSTSLLQRKLRIGFSRANALLDTMQEDGLVAPPGGGLTRTMLVSADYFVAVDAELERPAHPWKVDVALDQEAAGQRRIRNTT